MRILCFKRSKYNFIFEKFKRFKIISVFQVDISLEGRTWAMAEVPDMMSNLIRPSPVISDTWPYPPAVVKQHFLPPRTFVVLSAQVGNVRHVESIFWLHKIYNS